MNYGAHVVDEREYDHVRLVLWQDELAGRRYYMSDGTWTLAKAGAAPERKEGVEVGFRIQSQYLIPAVEALTRFLNKDLPSQAEVGVLREALKHERDRVDRVLDAVVVRPLDRTI